ncbi:MAG: M28 family peptidase [Deltaproteobacteria bacterium]|nr:M28 family peptidase [Deltaproteobacteria bacterium]
MTMPGEPFSGRIPALTTEEAGIRTRLERHVRVLAGDIGERHVCPPLRPEYAKNLEAAGTYVRSEMSALGYVTNDQVFVTNGVEVKNIEAGIAGGALAKETVVVGAHYDSADGTPGADDNASGVAALIGIAGLLRAKTPARTVRFVFFVNEEPPFYHEDAMGSLVYARRCRSRDETITAMISLETIGHYSDVKGSQKYPWPLSAFYPDTGDFIGFVGDSSSRELVLAAAGSFRRHTRFPSQGISAPGVIPGIGWSDHWSFWQVDYPGVMVTDTAPFRNVNYHTAKDTPGTLDYARLARVTAGIARVVEELAAIGSNGPVKEAI